MSREEKLEANYRLKKYTFSVFDTDGRMIVTDEVSARSLGAAWTQAVAHAMAHYDHTLRMPEKIIVKPVAVHHFTNHLNGISR